MKDWCFGLSRFLISFLFSLAFPHLASFSTIFFFTKSAIATAELEKEKEGLHPKHFMGGAG